MTAPLHSLFAAGLFDSPWAVAVIVIVGALINWLSKRREAKQANRRALGNEPPPSSKPPGEFNLEETLRRLLGEEAPPPVPAPPPIPRAARSESPPMPVWREEGSFQDGQLVPPLRLPPLAVVRATVASTTAGERREQAALRFEQLNEQGRHPATVVSHGPRSRAGQRTALLWRNPRSARQAFVASLVFAPPKGLES